MTDTKRKLFVGTIEGKTEEIMSYIERLETERDAALRKVEEWNKDTEIESERKKTEQAYHDMASGFCPSKEQWKSIIKWERNHTKKHEGNRICKRTDTSIKMCPDTPSFEYRFSHTYLGTLGSVVCTVCEKRAAENADRKKFSYFFGEV